MSELQLSPLHDRHLAAGGRLAPFAGWSMPVQYTGIREEHAAVRERAGVFDVSHMGQIEVAGPDALSLLQQTISNDLATVAVGGAQYGLICRPDGGIADDVFTYRLGDQRYLVVTNATNHAADLAWLRRYAAGLEVELSDRIGDFAMLAVQGPAARELVGGLAAAELPPRMRAAQSTVAGVPALICGTGYTGEPGVEILCAPADAGALWDRLLAAGVTPAGLGARDTLRLEACFHLHGNDIGPDRDPIEAGLGWCCKEATGFVGSAAVTAARQDTTALRLVAFRIEGEGIARPGNPIAGGGEVTSGTLSPSLGVGIGMAYVPPDLAAPGSELEIDVRGRTRRALVTEKPLYRPKES